MKVSIYFVLVFFIIHFDTFSQTISSQEIIQESISYYGGEKFRNSEIAFDFRDKSYSSKINGGQFEYTRSFASENDQIFDRLNNEGFVRLVNGEKNILDNIWTDRYSSSVNSVIYFALLPYRLSDGAVKSEFVGKVSIKGKDYFKVRVSFSEESGGDDYEDIYYYWFDMEDFSMDYLAYSYETGVGGIRFREAFNPQKVNGLTFQDYNNFKANPADVKLVEMDKLFEQGKLELLSKIELKNIRVK